MVKVFSQCKGSADLIAVFATEEDYLLCAEALEQAYAKERMEITTSVTEENLS